MTTLIELQEYKNNRQTPLWRKLWLNVMPQDASGLPLPETFDVSVFPWLAATRTSEQKDGVTTDLQVNRLQAYWECRAVSVSISSPQKPVRAIYAHHPAMNCCAI